MLRLRPHSDPAPRRFDREGRFLWRIGEDDVPNLHYACCGLEVDAAEQIYMIGGNDSLSASAVVALGPDGHVVDTFAEEWSACTIAIDLRGALYLMACNGDQTEVIRDGELVAGTYRNEGGFIELAELAIGADGIGYGVAPFDDTIQVLRVVLP
jgi:hypothetical protein